jgi:hypothetical protein
MMEITTFKDNGDAQSTGNMQKFCDIEIWD